jgi:glycosyltransferase involved in cell wall biosynthesis
MTPLEPRGLNGGAGLVATTLVQHLSSLAPEVTFTLLTSSASHAELAPFDGRNVQRRCTVGPSSDAHSLARRAVDTVVPPRARVALKRAFWSLRTSRRYARAAEDLHADLLFCPFTVPYFWRSSVPCISIVYDLQHVAYPEFFSTEQRLNRQRQIADACARSERVVCISGYVRETLLETVQYGSECALSIPLGMLQDVSRAEPAVLDKLGLKPGGFLLYPANFWPHKNHRRLFEALRLWPDSNLKLVCTGAPNALMHTLASEAEPLGVVFAGYVSQAELTALLQACRGLIFPSLYEGFGMPVLEAMALGKPVLCSNVTSLPEVAGDAALYFDPTSAEQIAGAIDILLHDQARVADAVKRGYQRASVFGTARTMTERYLAVFDQVLDAREA